MARAARTGDRRRGNLTSVPIPLGGWNTRDAISAMEEKYATTMDNMFPTRSDIVLRNGFEEYATGLSDPVETLMVYNGPSSSKMFGAAGTSIFDVSSAGAAGAAVVTGKTNARWQWVNFGNGTNQYIFAVNGADTPISYDGSSWGTMSLSAAGFTPANTIWINIFQNRLFFGEKDSLKFWYLGTQTISGTPVSFDLSGIATLGGYIMAMGTWTRDGGSGMDDVAIFYTSQGEAIVYQGDNPGSADAWTLIGGFKLGEPVGRRCLIKAGSDLIAITRSGVVPMGVVLPIDEVQQARATVTDAINPTFTESVRSNGSNFGWQAILYPRGEYVLFNIPTTENVTSVQYVANTLTGAWCRFTGMNANCWGLYNNRLYFGGDGAVYLADEGRSDDETNITFDVQQAYSYFGSPGAYKQFKMVQPVLASNGNVTPALIVNTDYRDLPPSDTPSFSGNTGSLWDVALWDVGTWSGGDSIINDWLGAGGLGYAASLRFSGSLMDLSLSWKATNYLWEPSSASFF